MMSGSSMRSLRRISLATAGALALAGAGCATSGDMDALERRLAGIEGQIQALDGRLAEAEERVTAAEGSATRALRRAEQAETNVRNVANQADAASRKAEAAFEKTVRK